MIAYADLVRALMMRARTPRAPRHQMGPGRYDLHTVWKRVGRNKYRVGYCAGDQECERRRRRMGKA